MKKLIFIFLVFSLNKVEAQIPDYFGNDPGWYCEHYEIITPLNTLTYQKLYFTDGTETVNSFTYYKVYLRQYIYQSPTGPGPNPPISAGTTFSNYYRQDGRSIYYYESSTGQDSLLISYDLLVGDTFGGKFGYSNPEDTIVKIDSVMVGSVYHYKFYTDTILWSFSHVIEGIGYRQQEGSGIGSYFGDTFYPGGGIGFDYLMGCYGENNISLWPIPGASCGLTLDMVEEINFSSIEIFPNPVTDILNINLGNEQIQSVKILNLQGQIVQLGENENVDVSHLESGVYIISIITTEGNSFRKQFIKI